MAVEKATVNTRSIDLTNTLTETGGSQLRGDIRLDYASFSSFQNFSDEVKMTGRFEPSALLASDVIFFASNLGKKPFFRENKDKMLRLSGIVRGELNNLRGQDIEIAMDDGSRLTGSFSSRNLTIPGEQLMNIRLSRFITQPGTIDKLFPSYQLSPAFHRLGKLEFNGFFDGYFHDFVAYGDLRTELGTMEMDMRLDISKGASLADYSGQFTLHDFDLGSFSKLNDLGRISLQAKIKNGSGLDIRTVKAELDARLDSVEFKGNVYRNLVMDGYIDKNLFNGDFSIEEDFVKFDMSGIVNYGDSIPSYRFDATINRLELDRMKITPNPLNIRTDFSIDMKGNSLDNLEGRFIARNLRIDNDKKMIRLDSVLLTSHIQNQKDRYLDLSSELISFYFDGVYRLDELPDALIGLLKKNHPDLLKDLPNLIKPVGNLPFYYDFYVYIPDSKNLLEIIQPRASFIKEFIASGHIDHRKELVVLNTSIDTLSLSGLRINKFQAELGLQFSEGTFSLKGEQFCLNEMTSDSVFFDCQISRDRFDYTIRLDTLDESLNRVRLAATTIPHTKGFSTTISSGNFQWFKDNWFIKTDNRIVIGKDYIDLDNVGLISNQNSIKLEDINDNKGIKAVVSGFDISLLNSLLRSEKLRFGGKLEGFVLLPQLFRERILEGALRVKSLNVNDEPYGVCSALLQLDPVDPDRLTFNGSLENGVHQVSFEGDYSIGAAKLDSRISFERFPLSFLEHIIQSGISGTSGYGTGAITLKGPIKQLELAGSARAYDATTRIDYLGTRYFANDQLVKISTQLLDFTGIVVQDSKGNKANVTGGIRHNLFKDLRLDLSIVSPRIMALSTTKQDNPLYYGTGIGAANIRFSGPITSVDISLDADVFPGSNLTIPVRQVTEVSQQSFIRFNQPGKSQQENKKRQTLLEGVNLDMNLSIQPGAEVKIILDETAGDNIQGKGSGDIRLEINRSGAFEMYGNYNIDEGTYLFTALTLIQKPFRIRKGGRISWNGDPLDATIDLMADYTGERVSLDNFIQEYTINNPVLAEKARKRTDVDLLLHLTGSLLHPDVSFDLNFPNLDGDIKSYAFSKLQKLRADQNLMYTQAVTLLSLGAFLPQDNLSGLLSNESNVSTAATSLHTGLQYSAVLISKYLSGLFEELFVNSSWISGVDIDLNVINSQSIVLGVESDNIWPNEYTYDAKLHLFEDKASIELSGSYVNRGTISEKSYANGDFIFKYFFTEDRRLRIEVYSKREFDEFFNEWKWKVGTGLNYQMEFGSIYDFQKDVNRDIQVRDSIPFLQ